MTDQPEFSISFPLLPGDEGMKPADIRFKYAMLEVLAHLRGGITPPELADLGLRDAWDVLSRWVDAQRDAEAMAQLDFPSNKPPKTEE